jgi:hypothetical protein
MRRRRITEEYLSLHNVTMFAAPDFKIMNSETSVRPGEYLTRFAIRNSFLSRWTQMRSMKKPSRR